MDRRINALAKLNIFKSDFDYHLIRAPMVFISFFFGYQKWFQYEADALIRYISHGPLIFWTHRIKYGLFPDHEPTIATISVTSAPKA
jgi:uncharacterized membrane protein YkgB